jgi:hypothetical protein
MWSRRYPYADTGRIVAWPFALAGGVGGAIVGIIVSDGPPVPINIVLWAAVAALTAYMVFSSEGPRPRPGGPVQGSVADGVVASVIAAVSCSVIDIVVASGAGSSGSGTLSVGTFVLTVVAAGIGGGGVGALVGLAVVPLAGPERLAARMPAAKSSRHRSRNRRRKRR